MDHDRSPSPVQNFTPQKVDDEELPPIMQSQEQHFDRDSSSDDVPLRQQRPLHGPIASPRESSYDLRDRRHHDYTEPSLLDQRRAAHQATLKPSKAIAKSTGKAPKKPGPRPWASKPIKKNDMAAKMEVIREIEGHWGKGFIRAYIPKCHRPLVKRGKGGKRAIYRDHETDAKNWLPSVLKAILSIARLTNDKAWLKKAMNDVVRYRIKNTGNRKPQLVTTDFDVLEDMLVKDWDVAYSFGIRYKHLMINPQGQQETDEDIDHILGVESCAEEGDEDAEDLHGASNGSRDDMDVDEDDSEDEGQGVTGTYLAASGYTNAPPSPPPPTHHTGAPPKQHKSKLEKGNKRGSDLPTRPQPPSRLDARQQYTTPHSYGAPLDPWGRPMPYGQSYGGPEGYRYGYSYNMPGGHTGGYGYAPPLDDTGRYPSHPPGPPNYKTGTGSGRTAPTPAPSHPSPSLSSLKPAQDSSFGSPFGGKRVRGYEHPGYAHSPFAGRGYRPNFCAQGEVKMESASPRFTPSHPNLSDTRNPNPNRSDGREMSATSIEETTELGDGLGEDGDGIEGDVDAAALEAELRATELELKVAKLQAQRARLQGKR